MYSAHLLDECILTKSEERRMSGRAPVITYAELALMMNPDSKGCAGIKKSVWAHDREGRLHYWWRIVQQNGTPFAHYKLTKQVTLLREHGAVIINDLVVNL